MIKRLTSNEFIYKARKVHGNKYDYSKVEYFDSKTKIEIFCSKHGGFFQTPNNHLRNRGCFKCSKIKKLTQTEFIERSKLIHNDYYNYDKVNYINAKIKVIIICPIHGDFLQNTNHHLRGNGCEKCSSYVSKPEIEFLNYFNIPDTKEHRQVNILRKKVDGYKDKTIYEFLGDYFHGNPKIYGSHKYNSTCNKTFGELYKTTINRFKYLNDSGYKIKYIWESDWRRFKRGVDDIPKLIEF